MLDNQKNSRVVYALGETVLDLVSHGGYDLKAIPGGSVLNASVSLGRMGASVYLISEYGMDKAGGLIEGFLRENRVQIDFCIRHPLHKTSLALAFIDADKNATYSFYHDHPENLDQTEVPYFKKEDILLFGSFYSVKTDRQGFVLGTLQKAVEAGAFIYFDLNFRKAHSEKSGLLLPAYMNNISVATVVKGSDEDFFNLFGISDPELIYEHLKPFCKILIVTRGAEPLHVFTPQYNKEYKVPLIYPVSTIGAGDNFNAGFIYGLAKSTVDADSITSVTDSDLDMFVGCGLAFATETCLSAENYISGNFKADFWKKYI